MENYSKVIQKGIDLSINNPHVVKVSNCIRRGCRGISNRYKEETGVVVIYEEDKKVR